MKFIITQGKTGGEQMWMWALVGVAIAYLLTIIMRRSVAERFKQGVFGSAPAPVLLPSVPVPAPVPATSKK